MLTLYSFLCFVLVCDTCIVLCVFCINFSILARKDVGGVFFLLLFCFCFYVNASLLNVFVLISFPLGVMS